MTHDCRSVPWLGQLHGVVFYLTTVWVIAAYIVNYVCLLGTGGGWGGWSRHTCLLGTALCQSRQCRRYCRQTRQSIKRRQLYWFDFGDVYHLFHSTSQQSANVEYVYRVCVNSCLFKLQGDYLYHVKPTQRTTTGVLHGGLLYQVVTISTGHWSRTDKFYK